MKKFFLIVSSLFLISCGEGYRKHNGHWAWVTYDASFKKRATLLENADNKSFEILSDKKYARDQDRVFYCGRPIRGADPRSFRIVHPDGYAMDKDAVYLQQEKVIHATPAAFRVLEFPYSRDDQHIFCGTVPLSLAEGELDEFRVTNSDTLMAGMRSTILLSEFIRFNPEYAWIDTLGIRHVIVGTWGTGETKSRRFKGLMPSDKVW